MMKGWKDKQMDGCMDGCMTHSVTNTYPGLEPGELLMNKAEGVEILAYSSSIQLWENSSCEIKNFEDIPWGHKIPLFSGVLRNTTFFPECMIWHLHRHRLVSWARGYC